MNALFVANIDIGENEGIYKKVAAEACAIGHVLGSCDLVTKSDGLAKVKPMNATATYQPQTVLEYVLSCINTGSIRFLYIRHMVPSPKLIAVLRSAMEKKIKVFYEIPTYPYFGEQYKASRKKYRAIAKIGLDIIFWPWIYRYIDKLVVIRSSTKAKIYPKMIEITNGVRTDNIRSKSYSSHDPNVFRMVAVGTLYPYHGYDRVLKGMAACGERIGDTKVEFHVVGTSQTTDDLHHMADNMGLKNVIFHGIKSTEELNQMYEDFDVGLGCLALHRRNADIDTTLKVIEYYCRGVPVISTGKCPMQDKRFTHVIADNDDAIDIMDIYHFYNGLQDQELKMISVLAKNQLSWDTIMEKCLKSVDFYNS